MTGSFGGSMLRLFRVFRVIEADADQLGGPRHARSQPRIDSALGALRPIACQPVAQPVQTAGTKKRLVIIADTRADIQPFAVLFKTPGFSRPGSPKRMSFMETQF